MACRGCNRPMTVGRNTRYAPRCVECGIKAAIENVIQIKGKSGPAYDRWRNGMLQWSDKIGRG